MIYDNFYKLTGISDSNRTFRSKKMLTIPEELLLLSLDDKKGKIVSGVSGFLIYGLTGGILLELSMHEKLLIEKKAVTVIDETATGDEILDEALALMWNSKKNKGPVYWVQKLNSKMKKLKERLLLRLVDNGNLRADEFKYLWILRYRRYPAVDLGDKTEIVNKLKNTVINQETPDSGTLALISLVKACGLIKTIFDKPDRKKAEKYIEEQVKKEPVGKAVSDTISSIQAAVISSTAIAMTSPSSH
jgi:golgi phosphoprotein 3